LRVSALDLIEIDDPTAGESPSFSFLQSFTSPIELCIPFIAGGRERGMTFL
jgi:hypothetical protein